MRSTDGHTGSALYLELLDTVAHPAVRGVPTVIALVSTDPSVAMVPPTATIPAGTSAVHIPVTVTGRGGTTTVQARAPGLASTGAVLRTIAAAGPALGALGAGGGRSGHSPFTVVPHPVG